MDSFQSSQPLQIKGRHSHVLLPQKYHLRDTPDSKAAYAQSGKGGGGRSQRRNTAEPVFGNNLTL